MATEKKAALPPGLRQAYLDSATHRLKPSRPAAPKKRIAETAYDYERADTAIRDLLACLVEHIPLPGQPQGNWLAELRRCCPLDSLAARLGKSTAELEVFIAGEGDKLINLSRLVKLFGRSGRLRTSEAVNAEFEENGEIVTSDKGPFKTMLEHLSDVADNGYPVLITGPTGTGKELIARQIHRLSPYARGPFMAVDCAAMPANLMESELFGHEKGAFTGAVRSRPGKIELAVSGTLFLDEIGELEVQLQVKLLRFLQEKVVERLGGNNARRVDLRVVAATSRDLNEMMSDGRFREDLYFRLATLPLEVPPLMQRSDDLPVLIGHFLRQACLETGKTRRISPGFRMALLNYDYPGNVRELANFIRAAVAVSKNESISLDDLPAIMKDRLVAGQDDSGGETAAALRGLGLSETQVRTISTLLTTNMGGRIANADLREALKCSDSTAKSILNKMAGTGLVKPEGERGGRRYLIPD